MNEMYITLTDIQNGEPTPLAKTLSTGELEVALCELTYYHRWYNIRAALGNNRVSSNSVWSPIPDGYYNTCELNEAFKPLGAELNLHAPTGRLQLSAKTRLVLNRGLAELLGFARVAFDPGKTYTAAGPHGLTIHREICISLNELSTSENLHNGRPSTLLRSVPVENEGCGGGRTETFPALQYKRLASGPTSQLTLSVKDASGTRLDFSYISATLHIREANKRHG
ncbi:MAG: hypothetical protein KZQ66_10430 [Candidatus Thiodiazotropha sp. (ex Lucinoma aequizonata)]|nr:hypothetical protein [Candidatus Thiodiazotropha sp. (ex Lucinoma aequizonata)]